MNFLHRALAFNSSRHRLWLENAAFAATIPPGAAVLDAGSGRSPYRELFRHACYESADFQKVDKTATGSTYTCDLASIPVEDGRFDCVVFNQVMEHLPEPKQVLAELRRVLRTGGRMIYTGPLFYEEHEQPYDFYRYTQFGLRHLFGAAGFSIERLDWLEGYFGTVGYQLNGMARHLPWKPSSGLVGLGLVPVMAVLKAVFAASSVLFHWLETRVKWSARGYPKNYVVIAIKPDTPGTSP